MENTKELILIYSQMRHVSSVPSEGINIMLTPQFYTLKRESIPVKYAYQAKRIAPSLFDGLLEDVENHKYFVIKEEDTWLFIAYNEEEIKIFLQQKGIEIAQVSKVFFAEQVADLFTAPMLIGDQEALVNLNGTVTVVPQAAINSDEKLIEINANFMPKKGVTFEGRGTSILSTNEAYTLAAIFVFFAIIYFVEGSRYGGEHEAHIQEMQALLEDYPALQSSYTRQSILDKYRMIDKNERKKRDVIKALSHMIFKGSTLTSLLIDDKRFQAQFTCKDSAIAKKLKALAKKEKFNTSEITNSNDIRIEGTL